MYRIWPGDRALTPGIKGRGSDDAEIMVDSTVPPSTRRRAADCVFTHAKNAIEIEEIEVRVAALEQAADLAKAGGNPKMPNMLRRLKRLESQQVDRTGISPHSDAWFLFGEDQLDRPLAGEDVGNIRIPIEVVDRILESAFVLSHQKSRLRRYCPDEETPRALLLRLELRSHKVACELQSVFFACETRSGSNRSERGDSAG